jgi:hypothetical protein
MTVDRVTTYYAYDGQGTEGIGSSRLSDERDGDNVERHEWVELVMVTGDDLAGKCLGERDTKAVGKGYSAPDFMTANALPKGAG